MLVAKLSQKFLYQYWNISPIRKLVCRQSKNIDNVYISAIIKVSKNSRYEQKFDNKTLN